jgi:hypothetical protein
MPLAPAGSMLSQAAPAASFNKAVQAIAISRGLRQEVTLNSIIPSLWLPSHPSCRRSIPELADAFSQVTMAELSVGHHARKVP